MEVKVTVKAKTPSESRHEDMMTSEMTIKVKHVVEMKWKLIFHPEVRREKQKTITGTGHLAASLRLWRKKETRGPRGKKRVAGATKASNHHLLAGTNFCGHMELRRRGWRGRHILLDSPAKKTKVTNEGPMDMETSRLIS